MKKLLLLFLLIPTLVWASPPSRTYTYSSGNVIEPAEVTTNEDNLFNYLTRGVDTYADSSIITDDVLDGTLVNADISGSAAIAYSKLNLTGSVLNADLAGSITYSKLSLADGILATDIASGAVGTNEITNGTIVGEDISASASIGDNKLSQITGASKVSGTSLTGLSNIPSGAGRIPVANLGTGTGSSSNFLRGDGAWTAVTTPTQVNDTDAGTTYNQSGGETTFLSVAKTITSGNTVLLIASGYINNNDSANSTHVIKLKNDANVAQTTSIVLAASGAAKQGAWSTCAMVTGLSGSVTFSVTATASAGTTNDNIAYGNLVVLEF